MIELARSLLHRAQRLVDLLSTCEQVLNHCSAKNTESVSVVVSGFSFLFCSQFSGAGWFFVFVMSEAVHSLEHFCQVSE